MHSLKSESKAVVYTVLKEVGIRALTGVDLEITVGDNAGELLFLLYGIAVSAIKLGCSELSYVVEALDVNELVTVLEYVVTEVGGYSSVILCAVSLINSLINVQIVKLEVNVLLTGDLEETDSTVIGITVVEL